MKRIILHAILLLFISMQFNVLADEGMWIPLLLKKYNEAEMQEMGMRLTADDIYNINQACLKDAVVIFGGGCTGEIISEKGLILTNHHCGYGSIQRLSSLEKDYLRNGYWAQDDTEELSCPWLSVTLLIRMEDVTEKVLEGTDDYLTESRRQEIIDKNIDVIKTEAIDTSHYKATVKPFYNGNEYYLFISEVFRDIRFVGAPPSNIGKFGGDTDNWMWPRHTGDFSMFRIYTDKNNMPAEYSEDNIPYKPKYHLPISLDGTQKGDFTLVFGYPGRTQEYISSHAVEMITQVINPIRISLRDKRLKIMKQAMDQSDLIRLQYSAKVAGIANGWKKWISENRGIKRLDAINKKKQIERRFDEWAGQSNRNKKKYGNLVKSFDNLYKKISPLNKLTNYAAEAGLSIEIIRFAGNFRNLLRISQIKTTEQSDLDNAIEKLKNSSKGHFKNYNLDIDKKVFSSLLYAYYNGLSENERPEFLAKIAAKYKNNFDDFADDLFEKSFMTSENKVLGFLENYKPSMHKKIKKDPAFMLYSEIRTYYRDLFPHLERLAVTGDSLQRIYMKGLMEMNPAKRFYPDANFTLRVTYGVVSNYFPANAVKYNYFTTLKGIMEKENPDIYDYVVEDKLKELYHEKDFGRYGDDDGSMHVCFIGTNHTTGGNSGSPVLNADGQLIGINFDRNWEGTMSDIIYDPDQCRNITLDIRYCLFIIDKFAGAGHLVDEMTIVDE